MSYERLLIWQYKGKPKALATALCVADEFTRSWQGIAGIPDALDIDTATGKNLDVIGRIVGQSRRLNDQIQRGLFAFLGVEGGKGFSQNGNGGGRWYRLGDPVKDSVLLSDEDYRFLIKCRIAKNYQIGTIPEINTALTFIFGSEAVAYDQYDMSFTVVVRTEDLTDFKRYAITRLDILPRPVGVGVKFYVARPKTAFGFAGAPGATGFNAGQFARIFT